MQKIVRKIVLLFLFIISFLGAIDSGLKGNTEIELLWLFTNYINFKLLEEEE